MESERMDSNSQATQGETVRIFIGSPGDVIREREKAKQVVAQLDKWYGPSATLVPVLWEDLPLEVDASFQAGIDVVLRKDQGIDIAIFVVWTRLGTPVIVEGKQFDSGTQREFELMLDAHKASDGQRPDILFYHRNDDGAFNRRLTEVDSAAQAEIIAQKEQATAVTCRTMTHVLLHWRFAISRRSALQQAMTACPCARSVIRRCA